MEMRLYVMQTPEGKEADRFTSQDIDEARAYARACGHVLVAKTYELSGSEVVEDYSGQGEGELAVAAEPSEPETACISRFYHAFHSGDKPELEELTLADLIAEGEGNEGNESYVAAIVEGLLEDGSRDHSDNKSIVLYTVLDWERLEADWATHTRRGGMA
jgi:hypothetical protein